MTIALFCVPYDAGQRDRRAGAGPDVLMKAGAVGRIEAAAADRVIPARVETDLRFPLEAGVGFDLARKLSGEVSRARRDGAFPLVLAGNCLTAVGTLSGAADVPRLGIVWLDAHGDLNTPETTPSGLIDGMALAVATGRCWQAPARRIPAYAPIPDRRVAHWGARDLDPAERDILAAGDMLAVDGKALAKPNGVVAVDMSLVDLARRVDAVYLHIDLDVIDSSEARIGAYPVTGGPDGARLGAVVERIFARLPVAAAGLAGYTPDMDADGAGRAIALDTLATIGAALAAR